MQILLHITPHITHGPRQRHQDKDNDVTTLYWDFTIVNLIEFNKKNIQSLLINTDHDEY